MKRTLVLVSALIILLAPRSLTAISFFQPAQNYRSGGIEAIAVAVADVNGDGTADLVIVNSLLGGNNVHGAVGILLGNGDGTFQAVKVTDSGLVFASSVAVADVNRDGTPDILVLSGTECNPYDCVSLISVLLGNGNGSFGSPQFFSSGGYAARKILVADVNQDGNIDLLIGNGSASPVLWGNGSVGVLLGKGDGTFWPAQTYDSGYPILVDLVVGDVNGDGSPDVLATHNVGIVGLLVGRGDGTFQTVYKYSSEAIRASLLALADVNNDGKPDLLATYGMGFTFHIAVHLGNGDGTFQAARNYDTGRTNALISMLTADVNRDGNPDVLVGFSAGPVGVMLGNGRGTLQAPLNYITGAKTANSMLLADVNGDRKLDLFVANSCFVFNDCSTGGVSVLLGLVGDKTTTQFISGLNPSIYGQKIAFTARVTTTGPVPPTGWVALTTSDGFRTFTVGNAMLNNNGIASLSRSNLNAGLYPLTAVYKGDTNNHSSISPVLNQTVLQTTSAAALTSSLNPSKVGQAITFTAKFTSPTVIPSGPVTFKAGTTVLGTAQLSSGKAILTTSTLPVGSTVVKVTYNGNSNIKGSSRSLTQTVQP